MCLIVLGVFVVLGIIGAIVGGGDSSTSRPTPTPRPTSTPAPSPTPTVYEDSDNYKGFHCLSAWDGNHDGLEALVRDTLNDPGSMETFETRITPNNNGKHVIRMEFGAKNAFGGVVRHTALGEVDNTTCDAVLVDVFVGG